MTFSVEFVHGKNQGDFSEVVSQSIDSIEFQKIIEFFKRLFGGGKTKTNHQNQSRFPWFDLNMPKVYHNGEIKQKGKGLTNSK